MAIESEVAGLADEIELVAERLWLNGMDLVAARRQALADHLDRTEPGLEPEAR